MYGRSGSRYLIGSLSGGRQSDLINRDVFVRMKNTAVVINVARGGIINEAILTGRWSKRKSAEPGLTV